MRVYLILWLCVIFSAEVFSKTIDFFAQGGIPDAADVDTANNNTALLNNIMKLLAAGDVVVFPEHLFYFNGGVYGSGFSFVEMRFEGELKFIDDRESWPVDSDDKVIPCMYFENITDVVFTSSIRGTINGNGREWWGAIKFLKHGENRPRLFHMKYTKNILVENLLFKDSPYWTFYAEESDGLVVRYSEVDVRWDEKEKHTLLDLQAFNTDGFDVTGRNVYMHDLQIWNDDDCISVKDGSENMLFERINASGLGLVIGSIGDSIVRNITFRDSVMYKTFKGIYLKTRWYDEAPSPTASISDILYENITIYEPEQWAIWIGPAQQTGQPCPLYWPQTPGSECKMSGYQTWSNIHLKDITIYDPVHSPGVLIGNSSNPMKNVVFENVVVHNPGDRPWGDDFYMCENINGVSTGETTPIPPCFLQA